MFCLTQILAISHRFAPLHPISIRFAQIQKISLSLIQIHSILFELIQIPAAALESSQIHTVSLQILSASLRLFPDSLRFIRFAQISSNWPILKGKKGNALGTKGKREGEQTIISCLIRHEQHCAHTRTDETKRPPGWGALSLQARFPPTSDKLQPPD